MCACQTRSTRIDASESATAEGYRARRYKYISYYQGEKGNQEQEDRWGKKRKEEKKEKKEKKKRTYRTCLRHARIVSAGRGSFCANTSFSQSRIHSRSRIISSAERSIFGSESRSTSRGSCSKVKRYFSSAYSFSYIAAETLTVEERKAHKRRRGRKNQ